MEISIEPHHRSTLNNKTFIMTLSLLFDTFSTVIPSPMVVSSLQYLDKIGAGGNIRIVSFIHASNS